MGKNDKTIRPGIKVKKISRTSYGFSTRTLKSIIRTHLMYYIQCYYWLFRVRVQTYLWVPPSCGILKFVLKSTKIALFSNAP